MTGSPYPDTRHPLMASGDRSLGGVKQQACLSSQNVMQPRNRTLASNVPLYIKDILNYRLSGTAPNTVIHRKALVWLFFLTRFFLSFLIDQTMRLPKATSLIVKLALSLLHKIDGRSSITASTPLQCSIIGSSDTVGPD